MFQSKGSIEVVQEDRLFLLRKAALVH